MKRSVLAGFVFAGCATSATPEPTTTAPRAAENICGEHAKLAATSTHKGPKLVREYIDRCGLEETIALTSKLVEFKTVSAHQSAKEGPAFVAMAEYLADWSKE